MKIKKCAYCGVTILSKRQGLIGQKNFYCCKEHFRIYARKQKLGHIYINKDSNTVYKNNHKDI